MNITFLIGNGFDIGFGLNTKYSHFYDHYEGMKKEDGVPSLKEEINKDIKNWSDFEKAFGDYSKNFKKEQKEYYLQQFEDFVEKFNIYLEEEEKRFEIETSGLIPKMRKSFTEFYNIRTDDKRAIQTQYDRFGDVRIYNYISFNYTNCLDRSISSLATSLKHNPINRIAIGEVVHIHGYITENMIMGVNDTNQIGNKDFADDDEVVNEIVKPIENTIAKMSYDRRTTDLINSSNVICIYGMSIGETDRKWWKLIANRLVSDKNCQLVILSYDNKYSTKFVHKYNKMTRKIMDTFLELSNLPSEKRKSIEPQIHIEMNHNIFEIKAVKSDAVVASVEASPKTLI